MRYPFDDETPLTEEEKYLMSQEIEDTNEISPFDTYDINKEILMTLIKKKNTLMN